MTLEPSCPVDDADDCDSVLVRSSDPALLDSLIEPDDLVRTSASGQQPALPIGRWINSTTGRGAVHPRLGPRSRSLLQPRFRYTMVLNPIAYTENVVRSFLRYQLTAYPFADQHLYTQMRDLLSLDQTRHSPLLKGPFISLSRPFRQGAEIPTLVEQGLLHPLLGDRISNQITQLYSHQERAIRAIHAGRTTLIATGTGSGKTECFLYPIVSRCLELRDEGALPGICAVIVYPMNSLAEDQLMRLRSILAGTGVPFGIYVGKTPEGEADVTGARLPSGASRAMYQARLERARRAGTGETVYPSEEVCSRQAMRMQGNQPRILLTNVKQLELLLTRQQDIELFAHARLDYLVFDEAHTFTGALGAETACLIRRLRAFCRPDTDRTTCIATSATIADERDPDAARRFASRFFGVSKDSVEAIGEDYEVEIWASDRVVPPDPGRDTAEILEEIVRAVDSEDASRGALQKAYQRLPTTSGNSSARAGTTFPESLYSELSRNELVFRLNEALADPQPLESLPHTLERHVGRLVTEAEVLYWLTLGAAARKHGRPLLRPVVHSFVRGIGGAVVTFPEGQDGPKLWLAAEDKEVSTESSEHRAHFRVMTCTTCGQHYYITFLRDFDFKGPKLGGGESAPRGVFWAALDESLRGRRAVLVDRLIGEDNGGPSSHPRTAPLYLCRHCGAAHPVDQPSCLDCGVLGRLVKLWAVKLSSNEHPGKMTSCLSCGSTSRVQNGEYREPARPVRAINVADAHVLAQDMVHHAERRRLLVFCDNRQDAAFQAGWMKDHARRFRLRALMSAGIRAEPRSIGDLVGFLDDELERNETLSRALVPEVWRVSRRESAGGRHRQERRKYLRFQVLREVTHSPRQALGLEPWGRMMISYEGLDASVPWILQHADSLGVPPEDLKDGVAGVLDYFRRSRTLYDPESEIFTKYWNEGAKEVEQGYIPQLQPKGIKIRRKSTDGSDKIMQWLSDRGNTVMQQIARKWGVPPRDIDSFLEGLFRILIEYDLLVSVQLKSNSGRPLPKLEGVYQINADRLRIRPHHGVWRCKNCRRKTPRRHPYNRCPYWRCNGHFEWVREERDSYDLHLLDGAYSMLRTEEHTAMVPNQQRERLENLFKGTSDAVNCLVCTPTLELGIDIGQLDSVLMRNVPPLPANYRQRSGRAGRRHRMAVNFTYCRPVSHDRAYFSDPLKLLAGRIDPPVFNLRNEVMVSKHVHAVVIGSLWKRARDKDIPESDRQSIRTALERCLPRRVASYLFTDSELRGAPLSLDPLRRVVSTHAEAVAIDVRDVFEEGWPSGDASVIDQSVLCAHIESFVDNLEVVVGRLWNRLQWSMSQIHRLNSLRAKLGALARADEALFRRCDNLVKRLKGRRRRRSVAEGHDDFNTFSVLAAEGFLPGYGLESGSVMGWAEIPFWHEGGMSFQLPRHSATALREYVPGNLIYANGHRFVPRVFHIRSGNDREHAEVPYFKVSAERQAVQQSNSSTASSLSSDEIAAISVCDTDMTHSSQISDEEELRFQLSVAIYGLELGQHSGGSAHRWGPQLLKLRRGVRFRLVNVGAFGAISKQRGFGYPVCTVCGYSSSPLSTARQQQHFLESHTESCGSQPKRIGFYANVVADALSLDCSSAIIAYSVLEALRIGATSVLDMHMEDLQILVIGKLDEGFDALLWDPMQGGSGLLDRLCERFEDVVSAARRVVASCPGECKSSCTDCLQTFRNAYYHGYLNRQQALERFDECGSALSFSHAIPRTQTNQPSGEDEMPVNDAEAKLRHLLLGAGFGDGIRGEQIRLNRALGSTTPDIIYRTEDDGQDEGVCIYLDGLSSHIHGNPETIARDHEIRTWLRNSGFDVIEIAVSDLHDVKAMTRHFRRLARHLNMRDLRAHIVEDQSWFQ